MTRELCGCLMDDDGRCLVPCRRCAPAYALGRRVSAEALRSMLQERTHGITTPTLWERLTAWLR